MRVLITGASGQLGRELVPVFEREGTHDVIAADRHRLDLGNRDEILGAITSLRPDLIVHAGAWTEVDLCEGDADRALRINALATRHVAHAARVVGARTVYVSTDYVFDGEQERPYNEWDEPNPRTVYGRSKLGGEMELNASDTIIRTSWIFGRHGANMVKTVLRLAGGNRELSFVNDQHGKPTCAEDLAQKIYEISVARLPGTFHVTNAGPTTWFEFARFVLSASGHDPERVRPITTDQLDPPRPAARPMNSILDNTALRLQGVEELPDHRQALERVVKELCAQ